MNEVTVSKDHPYYMIDAAKDQFNSVILADDTGVDWEKESMFAYQALVKNDYALGIALKNRESVKNAVINIASVGLSLNPATSYAYLVPRGGAICLDISYMGLIKIATDSGSISWAKGDLVYENDTFEYRGPAEKPIHTTNPFKDRGEFAGVYCIAKTHDGDFLVETIDAEEIYKIRDEASESGKKGKGPWFQYFGEMAKKACIKRASKTWPKTQQHERIQKAVEVINETEGSDWAEEQHRFKPGEKAEIIQQMREALTKGDAFGVIELVDEYTNADPEEAMKFWALFNSSERASITRLTDDSAVEQDRMKMGKPELNEEIQEPGL